MTAWLIRVYALKVVETDFAVCYPGDRRDGLVRSILAHCAVSEGLGVVRLSSWRIAKAVSDAECNLFTKGNPRHRCRDLPEHGNALTVPKTRDLLQERM